MLRWSEMHHVLVFHLYEISEFIRLWKKFSNEFFDEIIDVS